MASPATQIVLITLATLGKGFRQVKNPLSGFVDLFLSADAGNLLAFGTDGGVFAKATGIASSTAAGSIPSTSGVATGSLLQIKSGGTPGYIATVTTSAGAADAGKVPALGASGQLDRSVVGSAGVPDTSNAGVGAVLMTDANGNAYWQNIMNGPIASWPVQGLI